MVQLHILNGSKAGARWVACRFPFSVGRSPEDHLCVEEDGVWAGHCRVELRADGRFGLVTTPEALTVVNGQAASDATLRNGDVLELGSLRLQFSLSPTRRRSLRFREFLTWGSLALLALAQVALIYALSVEL